MESYKVEIDKEFSDRVRERITLIHIIRITSQKKAIESYKKLISDIDQKGRASLSEYALEDLEDLEETFQELYKKEEEKSKLPPYREEEVHKLFLEAGSADEFEQKLHEYMNKHQKPVFDENGEIR